MFGWHLLAANLFYPPHPGLGGGEGRRQKG